MGNLVVTFVRRVQVRDKLNPSVAEALVVPIPKGENPERIEHFRPISLFNVTLKLIKRQL